MDEWELLSIKSESPGGSLLLQTQRGRSALKRAPTEMPFKLQCPPVLRLLKDAPGHPHPGKHTRGEEVGWVQVRCWQSLEINSSQEGAGIWQSKTPGPRVSFLLSAQITTATCMCGESFFIQNVSFQLSDSLEG